MEDSKLNSERCTEDERSDSYRENLGGRYKDMIARYRNRQLRPGYIRVL